MAEKVILSRAGAGRGWRARISRVSYRTSLTITADDLVPAGIAVDVRRQSILKSAVRQNTLWRAKSLRQVSSPFAFLLNVFSACLEGIWGIVRRGFARLPGCSEAACAHDAARICVNNEDNLLPIVVVPDVPDWRVEKFSICHVNLRGNPLYCVVLVQVMRFRVL